MLGLVLVIYSWFDWYWLLDELNVFCRISISAHLEPSSFSSKKTFEKISLETNEPIPPTIKVIDPNGIQYQYDDFDR